MTISEIRILIAFIVLASMLSACAAGGKGNSYGPPALGEIRRHDPRLDALVPRNAEIEIVVYGQRWTEGPAWVKDGGYLLFSDIPPNRVMKWKEGEGVSVYLTPSGYTGSAPRGRSHDEPGSNGLIIGPKGDLYLCQHGDRRVARMDAPLSAPRPKFVTVADKLEGKRLNSPNDGVFHSSGSLFFTDPPYGLQKRMEDPAKELDFQGVYRVDPDGKLTLLTKEVARPNGIALSPDHKILYVASSDPKFAIWRAYDIKPDLTLTNSRIFFDATEMQAGEKGLPDGMAVDQKGNLFATGPGGVLVFAPDGTHLGTFWTGEATSNCTFGDDGSSLYITTDMYILRVRTSTKGLGF